MMIAAITGDAKWSIDSLAMPGFRLGYGGTHFGLVEGATVRGADVLEIASKHDTVVIQHWSKPLARMLTEVAGVERVLLWCDLDAMPVEPYWSPDLMRLWTMFRIFRLEMQKRNRFGQSFVDVYERDPAPQYKKPHAWAVALESIDFVNAYLNVVMDAWEGGYRDVADGFYLDNAGDPYFGTASNAPAVTEQLVGARRKAIRKLSNAFKIVGLPMLMGNTGSTVREFPSFDAKFDELYFAPSAPQNFIGKAVEHFSSSAAAGKMQELMIGVDGIHALPPEELFESIVKTVAQFNPAALEKLGLVTARTGGWLFCPEVFQS